MRETYGFGVAQNYGQGRAFLSQRLRVKEHIIAIPWFRLRLSISRNCQGEKDN